MKVRQLLRQYGLRPDKHLGQHFLADERLLERIAQAAELSPNDVVVEIGAGIGNLTAALARQGAQVYAVEVDSRLRLVLTHQTQSFSNVHLIFQDFLELDLQTLVGGKPYIAVGNLPYGLTAPILEKLLQHGPRPRRVVVLVQKEVAERMVAGPGQMNLLGLMVQLYGRPELLFTVPAGAFVPPPQVASALVRVEVSPQPRLLEAEIPAFLQLARVAFGQRRKQLVNTLAPVLGGKDQARRVLQRAGIPPNTRPEALDLEQWLALWHQARESLSSLSPSNQVL